VNILAADKLMLSPKLYATFLLWMLSELYEKLPEVGDPDKPKLVFFFDEAHLLFDDPPAALLQKIEQVVRLIRSKGVGVYFCSQSPLDIPDSVLGQLSNRLQHALRAFTPKDQKAVKSAADTFRAKPGLDVAEVITQLAVGEALVSFLDEKGSPNPVERALVYPPASRLDPLTADERAKVIKASVLYGHYEQAVDRESAFEKLQARATDTAARQDDAAQSLPDVKAQRQAAKGRQSDTLVETMGKSLARAAASSVGRQLVRGVLGSLFGGGSRRSSW
jgi:DNA helicase HerA-like ATPase